MAGVSFEAVEGRAGFFEAEAAALCEREFFKAEESAAFSDDAAFFKAAEFFDEAEFFKAALWATVFFAAGEAASEFFLDAAGFLDAMTFSEAAGFFDAAAFAKADFFDAAGFFEAKFCTFEAEDGAMEFFAAIFCGFLSSGFFSAAPDLDFAAEAAADFFDCAEEEAAAFPGTDCAFLEAETFAEAAPCATDFLDAADFTDDAAFFEAAFSAELFDFPPIMSFYRKKVFFARAYIWGNDNPSTCEAGVFFSPDPFSFPSTLWISA